MYKRQVLGGRFGKLATCYWVSAGYVTRFTPPEGSFVNFLAQMTNTVLRYRGGKMVPRRIRERPLTQIPPGDSCIPRTEPPENIEKMRGAAALRFHQVAAASSDANRREYRKHARRRCTPIAPGGGLDSQRWDSIFLRRRSRHCETSHRHFGTSRRHFETFTP